MACTVGPMDAVQFKAFPKTGLKSGRELLEQQYRSGLSVVERNPWAKNAYQYLLQRCPHLTEEEILRLFHNRTQSQLELVIGAAIFREYNAFHPPKASIRAGIKVKPVRRVGLISFETPLVMPSPPVARRPPPVAKKVVKAAPQRKAAKPARKPAPKAKKVSRAKAARPTRKTAKAKPKRK